MKWGEMQILLDYKRSNCYYVCVVAKNMCYYGRSGLAKGLAGGMEGKRKERRTKSNGICSAIGRNGTERV